MFEKYSSTDNLKQFSSKLKKHVNGLPFECKIVGTVKVHGMGVAINVNRKGEILFAVNDSLVDLNGDVSYGGWRDFAKLNESRFKCLRELLSGDDEFVCLNAEFYGGNVQTTGSVGMAPSEGIYIFSAKIKKPNENHIPTANSGPMNRKYNTVDITKEAIGLLSDCDFAHFACSIGTVTHTITHDAYSYEYLKELFDKDIESIECNCPFGNIVNPDGNRVAEGYVYTAYLHDMPSTKYVPSKAGFSTLFKVKGLLHKRKPGNTLTGVDNKPLNDWASESEALSNDRLQQWFDYIHSDKGYVSGMASEFVNLVLMDIEKECYVFLDNPLYANVTEFLINKALKKPISLWYKKTLNEEFESEILAEAEAYIALNKS